MRAVAEGLVGTEVPMALIPQGTGNLLARNLDLPLNDVDALLQDRAHRAETEGSTSAGCGWCGRRRASATTPSEADPEAPAAEASPPDAQQTPRDHIFLVIAGLGFDAAMVADTDDELKAKVGWIAYFMAGIKHLHARRMRLQMSLDESPWHAVRLRSVLVGNCGRLPGGITLLPDAVLDDGWLDVARDRHPRGHGRLGPAVRRGRPAEVRGAQAAADRIGRIDHARAREVAVRTRVPQDVQVDGDLIGAALRGRRPRGPARPDRAGGRGRPEADPGVPQPRHPGPGRVVSRRRSFRDGTCWRAHLSSGRSRGT